MEIVYIIVFAYLAIVIGYGMHRVALDNHVMYVTEHEIIKVVNTDLPIVKYQSRIVLNRREALLIPQDVLFHKMKREFADNVSKQIMDHVFISVKEDYMGDVYSLDLYIAHKEGSKKPFKLK